MVTAKDIDSNSVNPLWKRGFNRNIQVQVVRIWLAPLVSGTATRSPSVRPSENPFHSLHWVPSYSIRLIDRRRINSTRATKRDAVSLTYVQARKLYLLPEISRVEDTLRSMFD